MLQNGQKLAIRTPRYLRPRRNIWTFFAASPVQPVASCAVRLKQLSPHLRIGLRTRLMALLDTYSLVDFLRVYDWLFDSPPAKINRPEHAYEY
jgi:hypothetical protein